MTRPVVYGQAPGRSAGPVLGGRVGVRLAFLLGAGSYEQLADRFDLRNLVDRYPGSAGGRGDLFPVGEAYRRAELELEGWEDGLRVILLGRKVQQAFRMVGAPLERWEVRLPSGGRATVFLLPHPSGANGWWNLASNVAAAREALAAAGFGCSLEAAVSGA